MAHAVRVQLCMDGLPVLFCPLQTKCGSRGSTGLESGGSLCNVEGHLVSVMACHFQG